MFEILCAVWNYDHFDGCDKIEQLGHVCTLTGSWEARGRAITIAVKCVMPGCGLPPLETAGIVEHFFLGALQVG